MTEAQRPSSCLDEPMTRGLSIHDVEKWLRVHLKMTQREAHEVKMQLRRRQQQEPASEDGEANVFELQNDLMWLRGAEGKLLDLERFLEVGHEWEAGIGRKPGRRRA